MTTTLYLASPVEPSGASWLINCFLELGIKVSHRPIVSNLWRQGGSAPPPDRLWQRTAGGSYRLHPKAQILKKWLPALSRIESFSFRDDIEIEYLQDLPTSHEAGQPVMLFVRDPRDSLYSMYHRMRPALDYDTFLRLPNPDTLFDRPTHWRLFVESWMALAGDHCYTFESYKQDAAALLRRIAHDLRIECDSGQIERAVIESSYEKAWAAEQHYKMLHPGDWEVANRSGSTGDWAEHTESRSGVPIIERRASVVMRRLGYDCLEHPVESGSYSPALMRALPIFSRSRLPDSVTRTDNGVPGDPLLEGALAFAAELDAALLRRTNLPNHRVRELLDNLELVASVHGNSIDRINKARASFSDGSQYQLAQVRDLLIRRRTRLPPA